MAKSEIYRLAERMERMTKRELQKFKSANGMHSIILPTSSNATRQAVVPPRNKRASTQKTVVDKEEVKAPGGVGDGAGIVGVEESNEVTREMKLDFVAKIKKLSN